MPSNASYWSQRRQELDATLVRDEAAFFETMRRYYNQEAARLDQEIAAYYAKYGEGNVIEYRRLLESLSDEDKTLLIQRTDEFVEKYPEYAHLVPTRESIYQLSRLEGLRQSIAMQQLEMGAREIADATAFFQHMAARYANGAAELLGFGGSFYTVDHALVQLVVGQSWCEGRNFSARIWDNRDALTRSLYTDLVNGMIRGDSYQRIADAMQQRFQNVSRRNIERLVFTEDTFLANEAAMQVYANDASFQEYVFVATNDSRTCDVCRALDGQQFQIKERMPGVNFPPMHPWCRCFFDPVYGLTSGAQGGIINTGGKITDRNFLKALEYEEQAGSFYEKCCESDEDVKSIAANTGFSYSDVAKIKSYVMVEQHKFLDGSTHKFDPDIDCALAWQRMINGQGIRETDIMLLNHELTELEYAKKEGCVYEYAHAYASNLYDWQSAVAKIVDTDELEGI